MTALAGPLLMALALLGPLYVPAGGCRLSLSSGSLIVQAPLFLLPEALISDKDPVGCLTCASLQLVQPWGLVTQAQSHQLKGRAIASSAWTVGCGPSWHIAIRKVRRQTDAWPSGQRWVAPDGLSAD